MSSNAWGDRAPAPAYHAPEPGPDGHERSAQHAHDDRREPPAAHVSYTAAPDPLDDPRAPWNLRQSRERYGYVQQDARDDEQGYEHDKRSRGRQGGRDEYVERRSRGGERSGDRSAGGYDRYRDDRRGGDDRGERHRSRSEEAWSEELSAYGPAYDTDELHGYSGEGYTAEGYTAERYATGDYTAEGYAAEGYTAERYATGGEYSEETGAYGWDADRARRGGRERYLDDDPRRAGRTNDRRRQYDNLPPEDSWAMPALPANPHPARARASAGGSASASRGRSGGRSGSAQSQRRKKKSGSRAPVVILLLLVALGVIAGGVLFAPSLLRKVTHSAAGDTSQPPFATYTPGPAPTVVAQYKAFASDQAHYALNYPEQWSAQNQNDAGQGQPDYVATFTQPNPYAAVIIEQAQAFDAATNADILAGEVKGGQQNGQTFTATGAATTTSVGGEQWTRQDYDVAQGSLKRHMAILTCHHGGHGFAIVLVASTDTFAQLASGTFETILKSFRFTS